MRFEVPDEDERATLWQAMLPPAAPVVTGVNFASLARRFEMSGGYIRNAALRAAFLAADEDSIITAAHLARRPSVSAITRSGPGPRVPSPSVRSVMS